MAFGGVGPLDSHDKSVECHQEKEGATQDGPTMKGYTPEN